MRKIKQLCFAILAVIGLGIVTSFSYQFAKQVSANDQEFKGKTLKVVTTSDAYKPLFNKFSKQTGAKVEFMSMSSGEVLARMKADKSAKPMADLWFGGGIDAFMQAKNDHLLAKDNSGGWHFSNIAWCFGATLCTDNGDGTYTSHLDSTEAVAAMEYVYDLKWKYDVLTADPTAEDWASGFQQLGTGAAAMYIAANDAVAQPTQVNGLPTDKLAMGAIPAGPNGDQYSLTGGTPYMFSKDATPEQISAAFEWVAATDKEDGDITNKVMVIYNNVDTSIEGKQADAANRVSNGVPVIKSFPCWINQDYVDAEQKVIDEYKNVDSALYDSYFEKTGAEGNLRAEEPGDTQSMYKELTKVLQEVVTKKDCNVEELMKTANENYQKVLDKLNK